MKKEFEYMGYAFVISVEFNTRMERRPNGEKWHTVICNCTGADSYYKKSEVNDRDLTKHVEYCEYDAKEWVNKKNAGDVNPNFDQRLADVGFK